MKITFKRNYNSKLNSDCYIAVLPKSDEHISNVECDVFVATKFHHKAYILYVQTISLSYLEMHPFIPVLDVDLDADSYIEIIQKNLKISNVDALLFNLILFKKSPSKTNEKIAIFCSQYEKFTGLKYKISRPEIGMIARTEVDENLVKKFFDCKEFWAKVKSVSYYCKNINEIKRLTNINATNLHPNSFDAAYMKTLDGPQVSDYYKHLRSLNLVAKKDALGNTIDWVPKNDYHE